MIASFVYFKATLNPTLIQMGGSALVRSQETRWDSEARQLSIFLSNFGLIRQCLTTYTSTMSNMTMIELFDSITENEKMFLSELSEKLLNRLSEVSKMLQANTPGAVMNMLFYLNVS